MPSQDNFPFYKKDISYDIWKVLNDKFVVDIVGNLSPIRYRVLDKVTQQIALLTDSSASVVAFYQRKAKEIEKEMEKILLGSND
jgi:hypothetical protein